MVDRDRILPLGYTLLSEEQGVARLATAAGR
jgi:hypothetical protein